MLLENHKHNQLLNKKQLPANYIKYSAVAFQFIAVFVLLALSGNWVDEYFTFSFPYFTLLGVFVALAYIFYAVFLLITKSK